VLVLLLAGQMESVTVAVSHPAFCFFDERAFELGPAGSDAETVGQHTVALTPTVAALGQAHGIATLLANGSRLAPGRGAEFSVWVYGAAPNGVHSVGLLFYYDADSAHPPANYRLLRHTLSVEIDPAVAVSVAAVPAPSTEGERARGLAGQWLTVEVANRGAVPMELLSLSCLSPSFEAPGDLALRCEMPHDARAAGRSDLARPAGTRKARPRTAGPCSPLGRAAGCTSALVPRRRRRRQAVGSSCTPRSASRTTASSRGRRQCAQPRVASATQGEAGG
jgi:hypothetical protein